VLASQIVTHSNTLYRRRCLSGDLCGNCTGLRSPRAWNRRVYALKFSLLHVG